MNSWPNIIYMYNRVSNIGLILAKNEYNELNRLSGPIRTHLSTRRVAFSKPICLILNNLITRLNMHNQWLDRVTWYDLPDARFMKSSRSY